MNFGQALEAVKGGVNCIRREGWNGKGQHVYLEEHLSHTVGDGVFKGQYRHYQPVLILFNAQQQHQPGWLPSMGDLLADDWTIVDDVTADQ
jgi:hypothetical protein